MEFGGFYAALSAKIKHLVRDRYGSGVPRSGALPAFCN